MYLANLFIFSVNYEIIRKEDNARRDFYFCLSYLPPLHQNRKVSVILISVLKSKGLVIPKKRRCLKANFIHFLYE